MNAALVNLLARAAIMHHAEPLGVINPPGLEWVFIAALATYSPWLHSSIMMATGILYRHYAALKRFHACTLFYVVHSILTALIFCLLYFYFKISNTKDVCLSLFVHAQH